MPRCPHVRRYWLVPVVLLTALLTTAPTSAQNETPELSAEEREARARFDAGQIAYEAGRFDDALEDFRRAHELSGRAQLLYNIGLAADRLRQDETALDAYRRFVEALSGHPRAPWVRERISALEAVSASSPPPGEEPPEEGGARAGPWILGALSVAMLGTGASLLGLALADRNAIENMEGVRPWPELEARVDAVPLRSGVGIALLGVGSAAALGAVLWAVLGRERPESVRVSVGLGTFVLEGRF